MPAFSLLFGHPTALVYEKLSPSHLATVLLLITKKGDREREEKIMVFFFIFIFLWVSSPHVLPREEAGEKGTSSSEKANGMSAFPSCTLRVSASTGFWWIYFMVWSSERGGVLTAGRTGRGRSWTFLGFEGTIEHQDFYHRSLKVQQKGTMKSGKCSSSHSGPCLVSCLLRH